jgi:hypothetical protein
VSPAFRNNLALQASRTKSILATPRTRFICRKRRRRSRNSSRLKRRPWPFKGFEAFERFERFERSKK